MASSNMTQIEHLLGTKNYYDAYSMASAFMRLQLKKGHIDEAQDLCLKTAKSFLKEKEFGLGYALAQETVQALRDTKFASTNDYIEAIGSFFNFAPGSACEQRNNFICTAINWATTKLNDTNCAVDIEQFLQKLNNAAGDAYCADLEFGLAQKHYLKSPSVDKMMKLIQQWKNHVYPSEKDFLILRLVLALLSARYITTASQLLQATDMGYSLDDKNLPAAIQCAYLLCEACKLGIHQLFLLVCRKYHLVLRRDSALQEAVDNLENDYFYDSET